MEDRLLEVAFAVLEQGQGESRTIAEAVEHRGFPHAGGQRDLLHGHPGDALFGEEAARGSEDAGAVPRGVGALPRRIGQPRRVDRSSAGGHGRAV